jgi:hypothetical protein
MHAHFRIALMLACTTALGACAVGQRLGWTSTPRADATDRVKASCEDATRTLKGGPDHATALRACLDAKTRQRVSS